MKNLFCILYVGSSGRTMPAICFFLQWMFLRALPHRLGKNFFDKAVLHQFIDHAIVDDFGSERFGVDAFDGFELQDRGHISAIDPGCFSV